MSDVEEWIINNISRHTKIVDFQKMFGGDAVSLNLAVAKWSMKKSNTVVANVDVRR